tara:strand:- start:443 stop:757 length:315 start_codon:yes stop_codon:yes gene_type:complete
LKKSGGRKGVKQQKFRYQKLHTGTQCCFFLPGVCPGAVRISLGGFYDFASFNAAGTNIDFSDTTLFDLGTDSLKVRVESSLVEIVGMADIVADHWFFPANCTFF